MPLSFPAPLCPPSGIKAPPGATASPPTSSSPLFAPHFRYGSSISGGGDGERSFFLPPYWEEVSLRWSRGRRRERRDLSITIFDVRPQVGTTGYKIHTDSGDQTIHEVICIRPSLSPPPCRSAIQYMSFEFNCRTSDNVEMILEGTFFWEVGALDDGGGEGSVAGGRQR